MAVRHAYLLPALFLLAFYPAAAQADQVERLSEENISAFIEKTTALTSGGEAGMDSEQVLRYLDKHIDKKAFFKSTMRYSLAGYPPQETAMNLDKKEFMQSIETGAKTIGGHRTEIEIESIRISGDGKSATVQTTGRESAVMPLEVEGQIANVPIEGTSSCLQILKLNDNVIQMHSAICTTEISFSSFDPLGSP